MTASNTDLVRNSTPNFATTLANSMLISDTSMVLSSATGLPTATAITLVIDATDPVSGSPTPTLKEVVTGTLSGTTISNLLRGQDSTTQQAHASGANVVMWVTANLWNDWQASYLAQHTQAGAHVNPSYTGTFTGVNGTISSAYLINPYKFSVYLAGAQSTTSNTYVAVNFDTKTFDTGSNYSVSTFKFTAPIAGFYWFAAGIQANLSGTAVFGLKFQKNGSTDIAVGNFFDNTATAGTSNHENAASCLAQLAQGDYVQVLVYCNGTPTIVPGAANTYFQGYLVSQL